MREILKIHFLHTFVPRFCFRFLLFVTRHFNPSHVLTSSTVLYTESHHSRVGMESVVLMFMRGPFHVVLFTTNALLLLVCVICCEALKRKRFSIATEIINMTYIL